MSEDSLKNSIGEKAGGGVFAGISEYFSKLDGGVRGAHVLGMHGSGIDIITTAKQRGRFPLNSAGGDCRWFGP